MIKVISKLSLCLLVFFILSCARIIDVPVDYSYSKPITLGYFPQSENTVTVNDIEDKRKIDNSRMIFYYEKSGPLPPDIAGYQAEKPVSEIVRDALIDAVKMSELNYSVKGGNILIGGELLAVDYKFTEGQWEWILHMKIIVKLTIKDKDTGEILLQDDTFIGKSKLKHIGTSIESMKQHKKECFTAALDNLVEQIFSDEIFLERMKKGLSKN